MSNNVTVNTEKDNQDTVLKFAIKLCYTTKEVTYEIGIC